LRWRRDADLDKLEKSVDVLVLVLALKVSEELIGEELFSENDLFGAAVHKENKEDGSELGPRHFVFAAFDHRKADSGDAGSVTEFCLRKVEHFAKGNEIVRENVLIFFDLFFGESYHICIVFHLYHTPWLKIRLKSICNHISIFLIDFNILTQRWGKSQYVKSI
jgi:hypothetical protein